MSWIWLPPDGPFFSWVTLMQCALNLCHESHFVARGMAINCPMIMLAFLVLKASIIGYGICLVKMEKSCVPKPPVIFSFPLFMSHFLHLFMLKNFLHGFFIPSLICHHEIDFNTKYIPCFFGFPKLWFNDIHCLCFLMLKWHPSFWGRVFFENLNLFSKNLLCNAFVYYKCNK